MLGGGSKQSEGTHHVFPSCHQALVNDLCSIVPSRVDVYAFLDDRVTSCSQSLAHFVATRLNLSRTGIHGGLVDHPARGEEAVWRVGRVGRSPVRRRLVR